MINKNQEKLKGYKTNQESFDYTKYLKIDMRLKSMRSEIANKYGIVTLK